MTGQRVVYGGTIERPLLSRDAAASLEGRALSWVRANCEPVACHVQTKTLLLDAEDVRAVSEITPRRVRGDTCSS